MKLNKLLTDLADLGFNLEILCNKIDDQDFSEIVFDSRKASPVNIFFAIPGTLADGTKFVNDVVSKNVVAVFVDKTSERDLFSQSLLQEKIPVIQVNDIRKALTASAAIFYSTINKTGFITGVTGTNGKTSTAWIISQLAGIKNASSFYFGTLGTNLFRGVENELLEDDGRTSTDPVSVHRLLSKVFEQNILHGAIEITSHGIDQSRASYIDFACAVFTNLTQDHLDYHGTMENYGAAKSRLFTEILLNSKSENRIVVVNADDNFGRSLAERLGNENKLNLFDISSDGNSRVRIVSHENEGSSDFITFSCDERKYSYRSNLLGSFNVYNTISAIIASQNNGLTIQEACDVFENIRGVPGRLELVEKVQPRVFVDYAHTPDALEKVVTVSKNILLSEPSKDRGKLITVFGCGGDRDKTKRPLMAKAVIKVSDVSIITSDNPRTEDPEMIILDVKKGVPENTPNVMAITDRLTAIKQAIELADKNDIVLIAGKGHEDYQEIHGVKYPFDDRVEARKILNQKTS